MKGLMAYFAYRNDIKMMFGGITQMVMVMFCGISTFTKQYVDRGNIACRYRIANNASSFTPFRKFFVVFFYLLLAFFALSVFFNRCFVIDCFLILVATFYIFPIVFVLVFQLFVMGTFNIVFIPICKLFGFSVSVIIRIVARFAIILKPIFVVLVFAEVINRFCLFAFTTYFSYSNVSHFRFLNKRFWLEPVARYLLAVGSFYYTVKYSFVNIFLGGFSIGG